MHHANLGKVECGIPYQNLLGFYVYCWHTWQVGSTFVGSKSNILFCPVEMDTEQVRLLGAESHVDSRKVGATSLSFFKYEKSF